jgi:3-deoxy-manno-octulosonate cytidylyltransferase (CMP-KDO synthetase)
MASLLTYPEFVVVIPARYASTRLPGKPLLDIAGKTMIQRVYEQAKKSQARQVLIATDDERIYNAAKKIGADVCMTRADHVSGTDRLQEVAQQQQWAGDTIVVNVQGDEPLIPPSVINQVAANLFHAEQALMATLCESINDINVFLDPNAVKVVFDDRGYALYFSRAPIPWPRDAFKNSRSVLPPQHPAYRHIGIYAYRVSLLHRFVQWPPAVLEQTESLEQLRALAHGVRIHVQEACAAVPGGVDTETDLVQVKRILTGMA